MPSGGSVGSSSSPGHEPPRGTTSLRDNFLYFSIPFACYSCHCSTTAYFQLSKRFEPTHHRTLCSWHTQWSEPLFTKPSLRRNLFHWGGFENDSAWSDCFRRDGLANCVSRAIGIIWVLVRSDALRLMRSSAGCTTNSSESEFSVHTGQLLVARQACHRHNAGRSRG